VYLKNYGAEKMTLICQNFGQTAPKGNNSVAAGESFHRKENEIGRSRVAEIADR
jgi:hypothetical protein